MTTARVPEAAAARPAAGRRFTIGEHDFLLDGSPFRIIAGGLHYFRVHPGHWADRIAKARMLGLNTIETYVAWNAHEPRRGEFRFDGGLDLGRFLDLVAEAGMYAIVRPGPYICAEWDNGGLPGWLGDRALRSSDAGYLAAVGGYLRRLRPVLEPRQIDRGGPVILAQVENEYGAYGSDHGYLRKLAAMLREEAGLRVPLTTVDQPTGEMLADGGLPELLRTGSFGGRVAERLATLRRHQPTGPLMCSEFWEGWFDDWGSHHHRTDVAETAEALEQLLAAGASVNLYMVHGGTNFGLTNGANDKGTYHPITTSYDYDAPLDETGAPTAKYWAFREVIARHAPVPEERPEPGRPAPEFSVRASRSVTLWDVLGQWRQHAEPSPVTADQLGHYRGYTLYRARLDVPGSVLEVDEVRDRAQVFLDGRAVGVLAREHHDRSLALPHDVTGRLDLLVEDQGRVDYGPRLGERKGIVGRVAVDGRPVGGWLVRPLDLDDVEPIARALRAAGARLAGPLAGPAFALAAFDLPAAADHLHLDTTGWGKGVAWVNGFCLGRYWSRGPQRTLYVPGPVLRPAGNELVLFEQHSAATTELSFVAHPDLGPTEV